MILFKDNYRLKIAGIIILVGVSFFFGQKAIEDVRVEYSETSFKMKVLKKSSVGRGNYCFYSENGDKLCPNIGGLGVLKEGDMFWKHAMNDTIFAVLRNTTDTICLICPTCQNQCSSPESDKP